MSDPQQPKQTRPQKSQADLRAAALEKALRENLRRRKAAAVTELPELPSESEASGQANNVHEKAKEKPEEGA